MAMRENGPPADGSFCISGRCVAAGGIAVSLDDESFELCANAAHVAKRTKVDAAIRLRFTGKSPPSHVDAESTSQDRFGPQFTYAGPIRRALSLSNVTTLMVAPMWVSLHAPKDAFQCSVRIWHKLGIWVPAPS
jgi:hypothetical protein